VYLIKKLSENEVKENYRLSFGPKTGIRIKQKKDAEASSLNVAGTGLHTPLSHFIDFYSFITLNGI
jgi:hypothetical protein